MTKNRLEAFSDGVLAIIITIMVLELKVPQGGSVESLLPLLPKFLSYVLSFLYIGIYWNNHHHLLHACRTVSGLVLWANLHLLFWLSLLPFATGWMGESHFAAWPTTFYGSILLLSAVAYWMLQKAIIQSDGESSPLRQAIGSDWKGNLSLVMYCVAIVLTYWSVWAAQIVYVTVALIWCIPDQRIEKVLKNI